MTVDLMRLSAVEQAARVRSGEVSARELVEASLAAVERHNPRLNAFVTLCAERALDEADAVRSRRSAAALRRAGRDQGPALGDRGDADHGGKPRVRRLGRRPRQRPRAPTAGGGRDRRRQDELSRARVAPGDREPAVRCDLQPMEPESVRRRVVGRERGRRRRRPGRPRRRQRPRRLDPHSRVLLRRRRPQAQPRPGLDRPRLRRSRGRHAVRRRAHPHRPRCGSRTRRDRRRRAGRPTPCARALATPSWTRRSPSRGGRRCGWR